MLVKSENSITFSFGGSQVGDAKKDYCFSIGLCFRHFLDCTGRLRDGQRRERGAASFGASKTYMVGRDTSEPNAREDRVRLACKQWSANRESPGFIRGECQDNIDGRAGRVQTRCSRGARISLSCCGRSQSCSMSNIEEYIQHQKTR